MNRRQSGRWHASGCRPDRLCHRLQFHERLGRGSDGAGQGRSAWQMLGARVGHHQGPRPVGGRTAQHVEADAGAEPVDAWRQPAPVAALFAVPVLADQGPGWKTFQPRSTACKRSITCRETEANRESAKPGSRDGGARAYARPDPCNRWSHRTCCETAAATLSRFSALPTGSASDRRPDRPKSGLILLRRPSRGCGEYTLPALLAECCAGEGPNLSLAAKVR